MPRIFSARIRLFPAEEAGLSRPFFTVDEIDGTPRSMGFSIGKDTLLFDSRWEFNEPMIVPGTSFEVRFRLLCFAVAETYFQEGTKFIVSRGHTVGDGIITGSPLLRQGDSMIWPRTGPTFHAVYPNLQHISRFIFDNMLICHKNLDPEFVHKIRQLLNLYRVSMCSGNRQTWLLSDKEFVEFERFCKQPEK